MEMSQIASCPMYYVYAIELMDEAVSR